MDGSMFDGLGQLITGLLIVAVIGIAGTIILGGISLHDYFQSYKAIETKTPPVVSWKLEAEGHKVDTIWIYRFKK